MRTVAAAVLVLALACPTWGGAEPRRPTLTLGSRAPLVVHGRHFGAGERVSLTASTSNASRTVGAVAGRNGSLRARFELRVGRCTPLAVRAVGNLGSRALLQLQPGCEQPKPRRKD